MNCYGSLGSTVKPMMGEEYDEGWEDGGQDGRMVHRKEYGKVWRTVKGYE